MHVKIFEMSYKSFPSLFEPMPGEMGLPKGTREWPTAGSNSRNSLEKKVSLPLHQDGKTQALYTLVVRIPTTSFNMTIIDGVSVLRENQATSCLR